MKLTSHSIPIQVLTWFALVTFAIPLWAQAPRGAGPMGEWLVKGDFNGRALESILAFSRNSQGELAGQAISFWGLNDLEDIRFQEGQLTFTQVMRPPNGDPVTSHFKGTIANRRLSGTLSSDRGEIQLVGERHPRMSRAVGDWEMNVKMGDREFTSKLVVRPGTDNALKAEWQSQWGEHTISDVAFERGTLRFKRLTKAQDREWTSEFEGTVQGNTLSGTFKSERGEATATGQRLGGAVIGDWTLDLTSDRGTRKQRLRVNPDLSGLYGAAPVEKIRLEGDQVAFNLVRQFGDRTMELKFAGKLADGKLDGELTSERGATKVSGTKVVRTGGRAAAR